MSFDTAFQIAGWMGIIIGFPLGFFFALVCVAKGWIRE
jgi:hypothetical protein